MNQYVKAAVDRAKEGFKQGVVGALSDIVSRLFVAGLLLGVASVCGGLLWIDAISAEHIDRVSNIGGYCACMGVLLFSLPNRSAKDAQDR